MTAYASREAATLGCTCYWTDPSTWVTHYGAVEPGSQMEPNYECFEHFPHEQRNQPNPILVAFRAHGDREFPGQWVTAALMTRAFGGYPEWEDKKSYFHAFTVATAGQVEHALNVLSRLERAAEGVSA